MKNAVFVLAIAGLALTSSAQEFSLSISGAPASFGSTGTFTFDIIGDASVGTHMLGGSFALETNNPQISNIVWTPASWSAFNTDGGFAGNGNYNPVIFGQLVIPGVPPFDVPAPGSELGSVIGSFQITLSFFIGIIELNLVAQSPFTLEVFDVSTGETFQSSPDNLTLNGATVFTPSPSTLGLFGMGGLVAARRRR